MEDVTMNDVELWYFVSFNVGAVEWTTCGVASENENMVANMLQHCIDNNGTNFVVRGRYL